MCIWGTNESKNAAAEEKLKRHGGNVLALQCDVGDQPQVDRAFAKTVETLGKVDSCFANAGVGSRGTPFVEMDLEAGGAEDKGGYAKEMGDKFIKKQQEMMERVIAESDVVITTAAIPGKKAPILVTTKMVEGMDSGSVVIDLAAERGGNCELTQADKTVVHNGVSIIGPTNLPATVPYHASQMYSKNITTFLLHLVKEGELNLDMEDEITRETLVTSEGEVVHERIRDLLGLPAKTTKESDGS